VRFNVFPNVTPPASARSPRFIPLLDLSSERSVFDDDDDDDDCNNNEGTKREDSGSMRHISKLSSRLCMPPLRPRSAETTRLLDGVSDFFCGLVSCGSRRRH
jgi:hypothetical protein